MKRPELVALFHEQLDAHGVACRSGALDAAVVNTCIAYAESVRAHEERLLCDCCGARSVRVPDNARRHGVAWCDECVETPGRGR